MKKVIIYLIFLFLTAAGLNAQNFVSNVSKRATTAAPFLNISQGARAAGMGSAFVAVADDPSAIFWNPAGVSRIPTNGVIFEHTMWIADLSYNYLASTYNLGFGSLGVSFLASDYGEMDVRTVEDPNGTGEVFSVNDYAFTLTWAMNLTDNFSIGFNAKAIYQGIWKMNDYGFALDMGVLYNTPFDGVTLGMAITNFGTSMQLQGTSAVVLYDQDDQTTADNERIPASLNTDKWELPLNFRVGIAYRPFKFETHDFIIAIDAMHPNDNYESMNLGFEYTFSRKFSLRAGYKDMFLEDSEESLTLGAGFKQMIVGNVGLQVDYQYGDFGRLKEVQKFSLGITF